MIVVPWAAMAASTRAADALRSEAIIGAATRFFTPAMIALAPSFRMFAAILFISATCMNLSGNIFSVTMELPSAWARSAISWACRSVGKPGYVWVVISAALMGPVRVTTHPSSTESIVTPMCSRRSTIASMWSRLQLWRRSWPFVIAAATMNVPASMRSPMTLYLTGLRDLTPSMVSLGEPMPVTFAPIAFSMPARSLISGSQAADSITVVPFARVAAISMFAVPRTVDPKGPPRNMFLPMRPLGAVATMLPFLREISAPSSRRPRRWMSTGRSPIAHPPGIETSACPQRARRGPSMQMLALILRTISYSPTGLSITEVSMSTSPFSRVSTDAPREESRVLRTLMSARSGTSWIVDFPGARIVAAIIGRAAFFEPLMRMSPESLTGPSILKMSINIFHDTNWFLLALLAII